jgi:hypothetical protein
MQGTTQLNAKALSHRSQFLENCLPGKARNACIVFGHREGLWVKGALAEGGIRRSFCDKGERCGCRTKLLSLRQSKRKYMVSNKLIRDHKKGKEKKSLSDACAEQASRDGYNEEHIDEKETTTFVVLRERPRLVT